MNIKKTDYFEGRNIYFRDVEIKDAPFILSLRINEDLNKYISKVDGSLESQIQYLEKYQAKEGEAYFIIGEKNSNRNIGTVRIYDKRDNSFCWGSWILIPERPKKYALESALLVYEYGFDHLGFDYSHFDVNRKNIKVTRFHERLGAELVSVDTINNYYVFSKNTWNIKKNDYFSLIR